MKTLGKIRKIRIVEYLRNLEMTVFCRPILAFFTSRSNIFHISNVDNFTLYAESDNFFSFIFGFLPASTFFELRLAPSQETQSQDFEVTVQLLK